MSDLIERWTEYRRRAVLNDSMEDLVDRTINELRGLCRCADEVRCDRLAEIERLRESEQAAMDKTDEVRCQLSYANKRIAELEADLDKYKTGAWSNPYSEGENEPHPDHCLCDDCVTLENMEERLEISRKFMEQANSEVET